jgi:uncharacterized membrane protein
MTLYRLSIALHFLAFSLWLGHMFVWSLVVGPALKKLQPPENAALLRERSLYLGGLGWYALTILVVTGLYLLSRRGIAPAALLDAATYAGPLGNALAVKLSLVLGMIGYQAIFGHKAAPIAIYVNKLMAFGVIAASVVLVRGSA